MGYSVQVCPRPGSLNHIKTETLNLECIQSHFHVDGLMLVLQRIYDLSYAVIASGFSA